MKKLVEMILNLFGNKKVLDLDNDGKIETLREEVAGVLSQFGTMIEKLDQANDELESIARDEQQTRLIEEKQLQDIIKQHEARKAQSEQREAKAKAEVEAHNKVKDKLKEFTV